MSIESKVTVEEFAQHCNGQMIPLNNSLSYFSVIPLEDAELQRLVYDPASAMPLGVRKIVPNLRIVVVAYLEKPARGSNGVGPQVTFDPPARTRRMYSAVTDREDETYLFLAVKDSDIADYHDTFYYELASIIAARGGDGFTAQFQDLLREELNSNTRGELEEKSWRLKEQVIRRQTDFSKPTKLLISYFEQSLADTLALYMHGLCCDIDVEAGPRQLASSHVRRRLVLLRDMLPPPKGVALFPEELPTPA